MGAGGEGESGEESSSRFRAYNIVQLDEAAEDYDLRRFPAVRAAMEALQAVAELPPPPLAGLFAIRDMLDWLGAFFGFQPDNVKNQREHIVLLLANRQMQDSKEGSMSSSLSSSSSSISVYALKPEVAASLRRKLLHNYLLWCSFVGCRHSLWLPDSTTNSSKNLKKNLETKNPKKKNKNRIDSQRELLYLCLYLLIWGEAANLRFMPECLCFLFHHMAMEMNALIEGRRFRNNNNNNNNASSSASNTPYSFGPNNFLNKVIKPIYGAVKQEADSAAGGRMPHSCWRNYDDMNEFFWSPECFASLSWPPDPGADYLNPRAPTMEMGKLDPEAARESSQRQQRRAKKKSAVGGKVGFVEQRSFWNAFRSFDRLWTGLVLMMQAMVIVAFRGDGVPWRVVRDRDSQLALLSVFVTWPVLRLLQAVLDFGMQYSLISGSSSASSASPSSATDASPADASATAASSRRSWRSWKWNWNWSWGLKQRRRWKKKKGASLVGLRMVLKMAVAAGWTAVFYVLLSRIQRQRDADGDWSAAADLRLLQFLEALSVYVLPELLAALLLPVPWLRNAVERSDWALVHALTWWFQTRLFVGRGLRQGALGTLRYTAFWLAVLAAKFSFSYFLEVRPLVEPTRELLSASFTGLYAWHEFFSNRNRFLVALLWAPVALVYAMDLQIWYAVFSALAGGVGGLASHIGEIRSVEQFKRRFPFFASAVGFHLLPDPAVFARGGRTTTRGTRAHSHPLVGLVRDAIARLNLRYGFATKAYKRFEGSTLQSRRFAVLWNAVVRSLREEDAVSDREAWLLALPDPPAPGVSVMQWPAVLLANELLVALGFARRSASASASASSAPASAASAGAAAAEDRKLWAKICKSEYRRCAVVECFERARFVLARVLDERSAEHAIVEHLFDGVRRHAAQRTFCAAYRVAELEAVHTRLVALVNALLAARTRGDDGIPRVVAALQDLYDVLTRDLIRDRNYLDSFFFFFGSGKARGGGGEQQLLFVKAVRLPGADDEEFFSGLTRLAAILTTRDSLDAVPRNAGARRRIAFFANSLFMDMPRAPPVARMRAFSVLTPYYSEDVAYSRDQLRTPNADGITVLFYLQSVFPDEWENFVERMGSGSSARPSADELWNDKDTARKLRMWASYRGQTLARTVRGMSYYQTALETLAALDSVSEVKHSSTPPPAVADAAKAAAQLKFVHVVACQIYGAQKAKKDPKADEILFLMKAHPAMRVAYVDETDASGADEQKRHYSVLVKYDAVLGREVEIYRIQLPGPMKLGEGKPENQNHALIFTRGDAVQAIDMNQDNNFEEALKVRNLLQEMSRRPSSGPPPQILGLREHVLTGPVSSVAHFMSSQEMSFVTLGQRVLAEPLRVRMHYGHPDFFDRLWFLARGGVSKASRSINISEDIFAGFNCTLRGGRVTHHEYIQAGKGRDVGLNQIALFEAKVSAGNAEQLLSRDVYRLGHRLDFFRMLSFYHTSVGFYVNNLLVVLSVYAFLWGRVYLALSGLGDSSAAAASFGSSALTAAVNQQFVVQLGVFAALPMLVENCLEHGAGGALWDFLVMQFELCAVFFTFSLGTKCHYFGRTLLHGGARYRATGRGFVLRRERFAENYRLYARSHFVKAVELIVLLLIYAAYGSAGTGSTGGIVVYVLTTFSSWFMALSWLLAPFVFNPSGFDWLQTVYDLEDFWSWLWFSGQLARPEQSWEAWWSEEHEHLRTTGFWGQLLEVALSLRFFLIHYGLVYRLRIAAGSTSVLVYFVSWIYVVAAMALYLGLAAAADRYAPKRHLRYRGIQLLALLLVLLVLLLLLKLTQFAVSDFFLSSLAFLPTGWGILSICLVVKPLLVGTAAWPVVVALARLYELAIAAIVLVPLALLSWFPGFQAMQSRILFNQAFSKGLLISRLLSGKKSQS